MQSQSSAEADTHINRAHDEQEKKTGNHTRKRKHSPESERKHDDESTSETEDGHEVKGGEDGGNRETTQQHVKDSQVCTLYARH
jgi:hypothetical protein